MGMYSGIGSFAKKYQFGGGVRLDGGGVPGGVKQDGGGSGQFLGVTNPNAFGGNTSTGSTLPSYASVGDDGRIVIPSTITNRQFIQLLNTLGYFDDADDYDYDWLLRHFSAGSEAGDGTWLAQKYNTPNSDLDVSAIANMGFTDQNKDVFTRLFEFVNTGSRAGGFTFGGPSVGQPGGGPDGGTGGGTSNYVPRPLTLGPRPTGGVEGAPYYSLSDILVTSSEQPNLYDRFDPYPEGGLPVTDPYSGAVTQSSPYPAAPPLPNITPVTTSATPVDGTVDEPTTSTPTTPTGGTGASGVDTSTTGTDTTGTTGTDTTGTTGDASGTGPEDAFTNTLGAVTGTLGGTTTSTTTTPTKVDRYAPDAEGYIRTAGFRDIDPYIYGKRGLLGGQKVRQGSKRNLSTQEFMDILAGQSGTGSYGGDLIYDPERGIIYSGISDRMGADQQQLFMNAVERARSNSAVPFLVDPSLLTDVEKIRTRHLYGGEGGTTSTRIGDTQYFVNDDGTITALDVKDIEYGYTPGFAGGGIVDVYSGDMANLQTTGEGIESFLNPERSKATLRRNLAKLAPRPTAPVMQQGIMPMAR